MRRLLLTLSIALFLPPAEASAQSSATDRVPEMLETDPGSESGEPENEPEPESEPGEPEPERESEPQPESEAPAPSEIGAEELGFWGGPRWFIQGRLDLGFLFLKPRFNFGYGTPQESFVSLEITPLIAGRGVGIYGGLRAEIPWGDLRVGARYFFTFTRSFLYAADNFDHLQVRDRSGPPSRYLSLEAQLGINIPIGPVTIQSETTASYVTLVEAGLFVFEEELKVILAPPFVWSTNLGVEITFGDENLFYVTPMAEIVHILDRASFMLRVGLRAGIRMWPDFEVRMIALPAVLSPDSLGAAASDTFILGLRWRWATDTPCRFDNPCSELDE